MAVMDIKQFPQKMSKIHGNSGLDRLYHSVADPWFKCYEQFSHTAVAIIIVLPLQISGFCGNIPLLILTASLPHLGRPPDSKDHKDANIHPERPSPTLQTRPWFDQLPYLLFFPPPFGKMGINKLSGAIHLWQFPPLCSAAGNPKHLVEHFILPGTASFSCILRGQNLLYSFPLFFC